MFHTRSPLQIGCPRPRKANANLPRLGIGCCLSSQVPTSISKLSKPAARSMSRLRTKYASQKQMRTPRLRRANARFSSGTKVSRSSRDQKERQQKEGKKSTCSNLLLETFFVLSLYYVTPPYIYPPPTRKRNILMKKHHVDLQTNWSPLSCQWAMPGRNYPVGLPWVYLLQLD